ncbi:MAG TPA: hypothetical protein DIW23_00130 [Anaerolineae bacterium]|nr:hypothetical protein [Anaerolineae bacterium]
MSSLQKGRGLSKKDSRFDKCYTYFVDMRKHFSFISLLLVTLACALPSASPQVDIPQQPADINALQTAVVQTAAAAQTQTAIANPSLTPTYTPTSTRIPTITPSPTVTFIFLLPTLTPIPTDTPLGFISSGSVGTQDVSKFKTPVPWSCTVIVSQTQPPKGAVIEKKSEFYAFWTIQNTGTKTWTRTTIDLVYKSGYRHEGTKIQDTKETVPPGDTLRVSAFFIAPKNAGEYRSFFTLMVGNRQFCGMKIEFVVKD